MATAIAKRVIRFGAGVVLFLGGVVGLFLPGLQGILMIAIGLGLMSPDIPPLRRFGQRLRRRYPKQAAAMDRAKQRLAERWRNRSFLRRGRKPGPARPTPRKTGLESD